MLLTIMRINELFKKLNNTNLKGIKEEQKQKFNPIH